MKISFVKIVFLSLSIFTLGTQTIMAELRPFEKNGKFGYQDESGNTIIKPQFTVAYPFENGMAKIQKDNVWGYIGEDGKYVIKPEFSLIEDFNPQGIALVQKGSKYGYVRKDGTFVIKPEYDFIGRFNDDGYCWIAKGKNLETSLKGLYKGDMLLVQPKYQYLGFYTKTDSVDYTDGHILWGTDANEIRSNLCKLSNPQIEYIWAMKNLAQKTILDMSGKEICKPSSYSLGAPKDKMVLIGSIGSKNTQYNYYDIGSGKAIKLFKKDTSKENEANAKLNAFQPFNGGRAPIQEGTSFYIINTTGQKISQAYSLIKPLGSVGYIMVKNQRCGVLDLAGNEIVEAKYLDLFAPGDDENIMGVKDPDTKLCGFINPKGEVVVPLQYEQANNFKYGRGCVKTQEGWGMVDRNNNQIIKCAYSDISIPSHPNAELVWVKHKSDDMWRCRRLSDDSEPFDLAFNGATAYNENNLAYVMNYDNTGDDDHKARYGLVDHQGNIIIPTSFDDMESVKKAHEHIKTLGKAIMLPIDAHRFNLYLDPQSNTVKLSDIHVESKWDY